MQDLTKYAAPAGRILLAIMFIMSGLQKLGAPAGVAGYIESMGLPGFLVWPTIAVEVLGGIALAVGYQTRIAALALAGFTLLAGILFHLVPSFGMEGYAAQGEMISFMKNLSLTGAFLFIVSVGAGAYAVDNRAAKVAA
ncbi:DoxX family protein [Celeribacter arenosi]|uniref:DoxX family protein n=1 Tax=Celeribacter arenosi TaxID=792649 RepID=A0ABP7KHL5_9RHOB